MFSNSALVDYTKISPNKGNWNSDKQQYVADRKYPISRITIHCTAFQCSVETLGAVFAKVSKQASSNYGIGQDGKVGLYVYEKDRSWCSSSSDNDNRSVTIEVSSDSVSPYSVTDEAYAKLLDLVTDICKRNGKTKIIWFGDKDKSLAYQPKDNEMVMTVHRWFSSKSCPGKMLYDAHPAIADEVNKRLSETECEVKLPVLSKGMKSGYVKSMQILLNAYINAKLEEDGQFGSLTEKQVKRYQKIVGYEQTGICDGKMWKHLLQ